MASFEVSHRDVILAIQNVDSRNTGEISVPDFNQILASLGLSFADPIVSDIMQAVRFLPGNRINYREYAAQANIRQSKPFSSPAAPLPAPVQSLLSPSSSRTPNVSARPVPSSPSVLHKQRDLERDANYIEHTMTRENEVERRKAVVFSQKDIIAELFSWYDRDKLTSQQLQMRLQDMKIECTRDTLRLFKQHDEGGRVSLKDFVTSLTQLDEAPRDSMAAGRAYAKASDFSNGHDASEDVLQLGKRILMLGAESKDPITWKHNPVHDSAPRGLWGRLFFSEMDNDGRVNAGDLSPRSSRLYGAVRDFSNERLSPLAFREILTHLEVPISTELDALIRRRVLDGSTTFRAILIEIKRITKPPAPPSTPEIPRIPLSHQRDEAAVSLRSEAVTSSRSNNGNFLAWSDKPERPLSAGPSSPAPSAATARKFQSSISLSWDHSDNDRSDAASHSPSMVERNKLLSPTGERLRKGHGDIVTWGDESGGPVSSPRSPANQIAKEFGGAAGKSSSLVADRSAGPQFNRKMFADKKSVQRSPFGTDLDQVSAAAFYDDKKTFNRYAL